jgi:hypothetical protein
VDQEEEKALYMCTVDEMPVESMPPAKKARAWRGSTAAAAAATGDDREDDDQVKSCAWNVSMRSEGTLPSSAPPAKRMMPPPCA